MIIEQDRRKPPLDAFLLKCSRDRTCRRFRIQNYIKSRERNHRDMIGQKRTRDNFSYISYRGRNVEYFYKFADHNIRKKKIVK